MLPMEYQNFENNNETQLFGIRKKLYSDLTFLTVPRTHEESGRVYECISLTATKRLPPSDPTSNLTCLFGFQNLTPPLESQIFFSFGISSLLLNQQVILEHVSLTFISPRSSTKLDLFIIHILSSPTLFWHEVFKPDHHLCTRLTFATNYTYTKNL